MAFLIMNRGTDSARERLVDIFWPDADPVRARDSLSVALWSIRRCVRTAGAEADQFLVATKSMVRWTADTTIDTLEFSELATRKDAASSQEALQLYQGDFLEGDYDNWTITERERLAALYESVLDRVVKTSGDSETAQRFIARNPYSEEAYAAIVEAELKAGRRSSAAAWVERCRKALSEVGEQPSSEFESRFGNIVRIEPQASDDVTLPFAGREVELAFLAARFDDAAKRQGSVTILRGEAGIGKSTLLNRASQLAAQRGLRVFGARSTDDVSSSFGPWPEIFRGVGAGDFDSFVRTHASGLDTAIARAIAARLTQPSALIVDDVHQLGGEALDIFVALTKEASSRHAILVGVRSEGVALLRERLAEATSEELSIGCLHKGDLQWALAQVLGAEQPDALDILYDRTSGHPLFFSGLLNSLVDSGALARDGHRWRLTKPIDPNIELPHTVRRFIEMRLYARGDAARSVACALALEPAASADDLASVLAFDEAATLDALDDLLALGLITQPDSGAQFAFVHDLIREVAAASLNVGRRTILHRAFAQRLKIGSAFGTSLQLARHLLAAGDLLAAAQSYFKAAAEAMEVNAVQDAIDRCDAGIRAAEELERTPIRDLWLARLYRAAALAVLAAGNVNAAIKRARSSVSYALSSDDVEESTKAKLELAAVEAAAGHILEQKSDAAEAEQSARSSGEEGLEAQALIQQANAARELGSREEALQLAVQARSIALRCGRSDLALSALEELLRTQLTWWLFDEALTTAHTSVGAIHLADPLAEAMFLQARSELSYLVERFDETRSQLQAAMRIVDESTTIRRQAFVATTRAMPFVRFACHYMAGKVALAQQDWGRSIEAIEKASALADIAKLPRKVLALSLLRIETLLQRNLPGDSQAAHDLSTHLDGANPQGIAA
ncbi:MAG: AAA family ATPase, partial [Candidatus Eremiobacteraeota bacterium]|nr:AAA family ATPase [Candidatus Eremiobacteraeota bacterium]